MPITLKNYELRSQWEVQNNYVKNLCSFKGPVFTDPANDLSLVIYSWRRLAKYYQFNAHYHNVSYIIDPGNLTIEINFQKTGKGY